MIIDLVNEAVSAQGLYPQVLAATAQGISADFSNAEVSMNAVVNVGAYGANNTSTVFQIEESADGSTGWVAISGMTCSVSASNTINVLRGLRTHRYVRANAVTVAGTTPSVAASVTLISQKKHSGPSSGAGAGGYSRSPSA